MKIINESKKNGRGNRAREYGEWGGTLRHFPVKTSLNHFSRHYHLGGIGDGAFNKALIRSRDDGILILPRERFGKINLDLNFRKSVIDLIKC